MMLWSLLIFIVYCNFVETALPYSKFRFLPVSFIDKGKRNRPILGVKTTKSSATTTTTIRGGDNDDYDKGGRIFPCIETPSSWSGDLHNFSGNRRGLILMDAFCEYHGQYLTSKAKDVYDVGIIFVLSKYMATYFEMTRHSDYGTLKSSCMPCTKNEAILWKEEIVNRYNISRIEGVICESDAGLDDCENLSVLLNLKKSNGIDAARRNKFLMNEKVSSAGINTVKQKLCKTMDESIEFALSLGLEQNASSATTRDVDDVNGAVIVKPIRGCGSDDVFLCKNLSSVKCAFNAIYGSVLYGSSIEAYHDTVLVQEYVTGTEYAIDIVSRNGEHKVAALWKYDKRSVNGAPFVYFATKLVDSNTDVGRKIYDYVQKVLDSLDVRYGMSHVEIICGGHDESPKLIEVNCRQHNMDFIPMTMFCIGYNALDMVLSAYLGGGDDDDDDNKNGMKLDWQTLPTFSSTRGKYGAMVHMVNYVNGTLIGLNVDALNEIQNMDSVFDINLYEKFREMGNHIEPTIDIKSDAGYVQLMNDNGDEFIRDYNRIVELMPTLFEVE